jgi:hypothetical protein
MQVIRRAENIGDNTRAQACTVLALQGEGTSETPCLALHLLLLLVTTSCDTCAQVFIACVPVLHRDGSRPLVTVLQCVHDEVRCSLMLLFSGLAVPRHDLSVLSCGGTAE